MERSLSKKALLLRMIDIVCMLAIVVSGLFIYKYDIDIMHYVNLVADKIKDIIDATVLWISLIFEIEFELLC